MDVMRLGSLLLLLGACSASKAPPAVGSSVPPAPIESAAPPPFFAVPDQPATEFRCFAWSASRGLGACVVGQAWSKTSRRVSSFTLVQFALRRDVVAPPCVCSIRDAQCTDWNR
jgi:hypothetical protein